MKTEPRIVEYHPAIGEVLQLISPTFMTYVGRLGSSPGEQRIVSHGEMTVVMDETRNRYPALAFRHPSFGFSVQLDFTKGRCDGLDIIYEGDLIAFVKAMGGSPTPKQCRLIAALQGA